MKVMSLVAVLHMVFVSPIHRLALDYICPFILWDWYKQWSTLLCLLVYWLVPEHLRSEIYIILSQVTFISFFFIIFILIYWFFEIKCRWFKYQYILFQDSKNALQNQFLKKEVLCSIVPLVGNVVITYIFIS